MSESLENFASAKLKGLEAVALKRELLESRREAGAVVWRGGRRFVSFSCNDYLGLSTHPAVIDAAVAAAREFGVGAGASRAVTGNHPLYAALEARLAAMKGTEAALVFGSGYLTNVGIISALVGRQDLVVLDELGHSCMFAGARLAGAEVVTFPHNDVAALREVLAARRGAFQRCLIATETVFSMDGDLAPVSEICALAKKFDAWVLTDDAHGLGVVKVAGSGEVPLQMGTLSKAVGGYGGYLCASEKVVALIRNRARSFVYTTGLPPATVAGAVAALDFIGANPEFAALPVAKARRFTSALGLREAQSPIVPVVIGGAREALAVSAALQEARFLVAAIRPPTVKAGTARLRVAFCARHEDGDVDRLAEVLGRIAEPGKLN